MLSDVRRENLKRLIEHLGISQAELARKTGKPQQQISNILRGSKNLGERLARYIEEKLGVEPFYLDRESNVVLVAPTKNTKKVPLISWVQAGCPQDTGDNDYSEYIIVSDDIPDGCFALTVVGDSMTPILNEGDIVIVDPNKTPKPGSIVVARIFSNSGTIETTLKQYASVGFDSFGRETFELRPTNNLYPTYKSDQMQIEIVAVVIEGRKRF